MSFFQKKEKKDTTMATAMATAIQVGGKRPGPGAGGRGGGISYGTGGGGGGGTGGRNVGVSGSKKAKVAMNNPLGFTSSHSSQGAIIDLIKSSESAGTVVKRKGNINGGMGPCMGGMVERQTCPICNFAFPKTALNTEVNAHLDKCIAETVL